MARNSKPHIEFEGTVLRAYPYSDAHLILKVLSPSQGKVSLIAKGARQSKKRFPNSFDYFDTGKFRVSSHSSRADSLGDVLEFTPIKSFGALRTDLPRLIVGSLLCECFESLIAESSPEAGDCYELLELGLNAISNSEDSKSALKACFFSIANLLRREGLLGKEPMVPTGKTLLHLLGIIESNINRKLNSEAALLDLLVELRNSEIKNPPPDS